MSLSGNPERWAVLAPDPDVVMLNRGPCEPLRVALVEWVTKHGVDPNRVCVTFLVRDEANRRIVYEVECTDNTHPGIVAGILISQSPESHLREPKPSEQPEPHVCTVPAYIQLEAEPLPWPPEVAEHCTPVDDVPVPYAGQWDVPLWVWSAETEKACLQRREKAS